MTLIYIICALIGIGLIIFIHEAGHFMAAKKVGVRVERFAIGFDPPFRGRNLRFLTFKRGETEYVIGMIPFGGYVKMAGETLMAGDGEGKPDELISKSVGARALVFAAGAIMNILSAFVFFIIAFSIGVPFVDSEVGDTPPGAPAWEAGIRPGDRIVEIDGEKIQEQTKVRIAVALGDPNEPLTIKVERPQESGEPVPHTFQVTPRQNTANDLLWIGVVPGISNELNYIEPDGLAARAGLQKGDRLVGAEVDGVVLPEMPTKALFEILDKLETVHAETPVRIQVLRKNEKDPRWIDFLQPRPKTGEMQPIIGVQSGLGFGGANVVRGLRPDSEVARLGVFRPGDTILHIDGEVVDTVTWLQILEKSKEGRRELELEILGRNAAVREVRVDTSKLLAWIVRDDIQWSRYDAVVPRVDSQSSLAEAGIEAGDRVIGLGGKPCYTPDGMREILRESTGDTLQVDLLRGRPGSAPEAPSGWTAETKSLSRPDVEVLAKLVKQPFAPLSEVAEGGPAAAAGIERGAVIEQIGADRIAEWSDLYEAVKKHKIGDRVAISWRTVDGEAKEGEITIGSRKVEPFGFIEREDGTMTLALKTRVMEGDGIGGSCRMGFDRTIVVSKWVFLTLRSLIRRQVSPKHLSGPLGITQLLTKVSEQGNLATMLYWLALISVNLGLFNLLPFPVLDGGHLTFLLIEKIKGSPVDIRIQEWATNIAFLLILALAVFVTFHDVMRLL